MEQDNTLHEEDVRGYVWNEFAKKPRQLYEVSLNSPWNSFAAEDPSVNRNLSAPKPDYGCYRRINDYPSHAVEALGGYLQPNFERNSAMPHFITEVKGPSYSTSNAFHQAAHTGAAIVESDQKAFEYAKQPFPEGGEHGLFLDSSLGTSWN